MDSSRSLLCHWLRHSTGKAAADDDTASQETCLFGQHCYTDAGAIQGSACICLALQHTGKRNGLPQSAAGVYLREIGRC